MGVSLLLLTLVFSFLLGSVPWGIIIARLFFRTDIRTHGSGNIGTTNALRTLGKRGGGAVFALDFGKGLLAGLAAWAVASHLAPFLGVPLVDTPPGGLQALLGAVTSGGAGDGAAAGAAGGVVAAAAAPTASATPAGGVLHEADFLMTALAGCTLGHIFSPWLGFKGGKGIAVAIGCVFVSYGWVGAFIELGLFAALVALTRYVSIGSIAAALLCPVLALVLFWGDWLAVSLGVLLAVAITWAHRDNIRHLREGSENRIGKKGGEKRRQH
ncbi:MAG: glycerol-3-phosphate acyltransferase [Coriobacteriales bacterium]|jgi:glycerol-3-phosphate acyltransferase PlsY|nr:glycerol-3-phosphate acyltransferase [Coriobacteriales bacterium]